jgi:hypothetical protein
MAFYRSGKTLRAVQFNGTATPFPGMKIYGDGDGPYVNVMTVGGLTKARTTDWIVKKKNRPFRVLSNKRARSELAIL